MGVNVCCAQVCMHCVRTCVNTCVCTRVGARLSMYICILGVYARMCMHM